MISQPTHISYAMVHISCGGRHCHRALLPGLRPCDALFLPPPGCSMRPSSLATLSDRRGHHILTDEVEGPVISTNASSVIITTIITSAGLVDMTSLTISH